jgi:hypothetical protein
MKSNYSELVKVFSSFIFTKIIRTILGYNLLKGIDKIRYFRGFNKEKFYKSGEFIDYYEMKLVFRKNNLEINRSSCRR